MKYIIYTLRITAWLLAAVSVAVLFTALPNLPWPTFKSDYHLHTVILPMVFVPLFYLHTLAGFWFLLSRHKRLNKLWIKVETSILWTAILIVFGWFYAINLTRVDLQKTLNNTAGHQTNAANSSLSVSVPNSKTVGSITTVLTANEVSKHNKIDDCWLIINDKVYDVTRYLGVHPGGPSTIIPYCGKDATAAFADLPHSQSAVNLLQSFYIGNLGGPINQQSAKKVKTQPLPVKAVTNGGEEND